MKKSIKRRALAMLMAMAMLLTAAPATPLARAEETLSTNVTEPFFSTANIPNPSTGGTTTSNSYRIPAMVTLKDGTIVAAADTRWNTTYDGGGLDTLVARSTDGGVSWEYTMANYLGDNGNTYNGSSSTCFIDPCLTVAADGQTVYMLCDLYPYGVALNGSGNTAPSTAVGFTTQGYLKLSNDNHNSYGYYLKDGKIYSANNNQEVSGYTVDAHFNLYQNGEKISNLFFADSRYKVVRTGFLYLTKSTDGGRTWSDPTLLNLKTSSEQVCLVGPGRGITTKNGTMVFPVYSYNGSESSQRMGFVYYNENEGWQRVQSDNAWSSEAAVVEIGQGTLRFFYRNGTTNLTYVDYNMAQKTWGYAQSTGVKVNSNTQLSAITYSKTVNGKQVILVSCPKGPGTNGSSNSNGAYRLNGHIYVGVVESATTMTWTDAINVSGTNASSALGGSDYTAAQGFFAYSCLTERADGSIAILYENTQNGWGAGSGYGYAMDMKAYSASALGLTFDETTDPGEGGGTVTDGTIEMFVGDEATLTIPGANYENNAHIADGTVASMTVVGKDEVPGGTTTTITYNAINDIACSVLMPNTTKTPIATGYYYLYDGAYYEVYATRVESSEWFNTNTTYTWGFYLNSEFKEIDTVTTSWFNSNPTVSGLYEKTETTTSTAPQPASTTVTFKGLKPGETVATIGNATYAVIVKAKTEESTVFLKSGNSAALDAIADLGLSGNGYTVTYTTDNALVSVANGVVTAGQETGTATVIATVSNNGAVVGTVTYTITVSDIVITDTKNIYVPVGGTAIIEGLTGDIHTGMFDESTATYSVDGNQAITFTGVAVGKTALVVGETQINVFVNPKNTGSGANTQKYLYVNIEKIEHCTVYCSINGSDLIEIQGEGVLIDQSYEDGMALILFAAPEEGYALAQMLGSNIYAADGTNNPKPMDGAFFALRNGKNANGEVDVTLGAAWPLNADGSYKSHGWQWMLKEGNISAERLQEVMEAAAELGCDGASVITRNNTTGTSANTEADMDWEDVAVNFSFVAERLPTFDKTIVSVNGQPYTEDTVIEFNDEITYRFTVTSYSSNVKYTTVTIRDDLIGFVHTVPAGRLDTAGSYSVTADYTVNVGDVDKYAGGKFLNKAQLRFDYKSQFASGQYEFTDSASVSCDISGMVYYTWADNVPAGITGNTAVYPLPDQAVVTYNTTFQVKPYTGATEYVAVENGVAVGKWTFKGWNLAGTEYTGGETVTMSSQGSLAFEGVWEYTAYPTYTVTYQWIGAPTTGVTLPTDGGNYYSGQTYRVDGTYTPGHTFTVDGVEYTFNGWKLNGSPVSGQQTMGQSNVILVGEWTSSQLYTSLVIRKTGAQAIDVNQTFLFRIQGEGVDLTVAVHGDGYAVVEGLKVGGTYTVTEITRWSWRYAFESYETNLPNTAAEHGATVTLGAENNEITFTCQRIVNWWLDGDHWIDNTFTGKS